MVSKSAVDGVEVMAYSAVHQKTKEVGILVLPWVNNTRTTSKPGIGVPKNGKIINDGLGNTYIPKAMIHTHPDELQWSTDDLIASSYWEKRYPEFRSFIIHNGEVIQYSPISLQLWKLEEFQIPK